MYGLVNFITNAMPAVIAIAVGVVPTMLINMKAKLSLRLYKLLRLHNRPVLRMVIGIVLFGTAMFVVQRILPEDYFYMFGRAFSMDYIRYIMFGAIMGSFTIFDREETEEQKYPLSLEEVQEVLDSEHPE